MISRKHIATTLKVIVGIGLIYFVVREANADELRQVMQRLSWLGLGVAVVTFMAAVGLNAVRWNAILNHLKSPIPLRTAVVGAFEGMFFNLFLPTSVGGDAMRAYRAFDQGATAGMAVESVLIDRALGLWTVGASILIAAPFAAVLVNIPSYGALLGLSALILVGGFIAALVGRLVSPRLFRSWFRRFFELVHNFGNTVFSWRFANTLLPIAAVSSFVASSTMWAITQSIGLDLSYLDAVLVVQTAALVALLPVSFGGWGVREGVTVFLLTRAGVATSEAIAVSLLYGAVLVIVGLVGGLAWMTSPYRGIARFSDMGWGRKPVGASRGPDVK